MIIKTLCCGPTASRTSQSITTLTTIIIIIITCLAFIPASSLVNGATCSIGIPYTANLKDFTLFNYDGGSTSIVNDRDNSDNFIAQGGITTTPDQQGGLKSSPTSLYQFYQGGTHTRMTNTENKVGLQFWLKPETLNTGGVPWFIGGTTGTDSNDCTSSPPSPSSSSLSLLPFPPFLPSSYPLSHPSLPFHHLPFSPSPLTSLSSSLPPPFLFSDFSSPPFFSLSFPAICCGSFSCLYCPLTTTSTLFTHTHLFFPRPSLYRLFCQRFRRPLSLSGRFVSWLFYILHFFSYSFP
eukprot:TRINITY_DN3081_c0_g1_i16.p1 TRINITY_DN3081_c0_g1~~TRINITY_DN3081_c0_g1_i16.p1  ORF type:complete len:294 (+),score=-8.36 TRINITY_DN3081_c0_g1_i16:38-919(+)